MQTRTLVRMALMAALMGALGLIPPIFLPLAFGAPITAQSLGVMIAGLLLGARTGAGAVALFVFVVLLGAPLLAGGRGGLGLLFGPTAGFLIGYIPGAFVTGLIFARLALPTGAAAFLAAVGGGILTVYLCGVPVLAAVSGIALKQAALATLVFIPGDLLKAVAAALLAVALRAGGPAAETGGGTTSR